MASRIQPDAVLTKVGSNLDFLKNWTRDNEGTFSRVMEQLADENPVKFAEIFVRVQTITAPPKETKTDINIKVDTDFQKLQALAGTIDTAHRLEKGNEKTEFTNYEELK